MSYYFQSFFYFVFYRCNGRLSLPHWSNEENNYWYELQWNDCKYLPVPSKNELPGSGVFFILSYHVSYQLSSFIYYIAFNIFLGFFAVVFDFMRLVSVIVVIIVFLYNLFLERCLMTVTLVPIFFKLALPKPTIVFQLQLL